VRVAALVALILIGCVDPADDDDSAPAVRGWSTGAPLLAPLQETPSSGWAMRS